jgi:hypothetical protein
MREGRRLLRLTPLVIGFAVAGCDSGPTEYKCFSAGLTVNIPAALSGEVISVAPSGLACADAVVAPTPAPSVAVTQYHVTLTQTGPCHLDIDFTDGTTFSDDLVVIQTTGCGLGTEPPGAADIDVPPPVDAAALFQEGGDD